MANEDLVSDANSHVMTPVGPVSFSTCSSSRCCSPPGLDILDRCLDGIFCQHTAVKLDRRQAEVLCDLTVPHRQSIVEGLATNPLCGYRAAGNRRTTAKGFELGIDDVSVIINLQACVISCEVPVEMLTCHNLGCAFFRQASPSPAMMTQRQTQAVRYFWSSIGMMFGGRTLICSFMTSPQAGAPTRPVPTLGSLASILPTLRGLS